jgi:uncharacterized protein
LVICFQIQFFEVFMNRTLIMKLATLSMFGLAVGAGTVWAFFGSSKSQTSGNGKPIEIAWQGLRGLDLKTGSMSTEVSNVNNQIARIPGFIVPLEDNARQVSEFLLVPSPQACVHVPAPPPNQMVHVKMAPGRFATLSFGPVWVQGRLKVQDVDGPYGKSGYAMSGDIVEVYK